MTFLSCLDPILNKRRAAASTYQEQTNEEVSCPESGEQCGTYRRPISAATRSSNTDSFPFISKEGQFFEGVWLINVSDKESTSEMSLLLRILERRLSASQRHLRPSVL